MQLDLNFWSLFKTEVVEMHFNWMNIIGAGSRAFGLPSWLVSKKALHNSQKGRVPSVRVELSDDHLGTWQIFSVVVSPEDIYIVSIHLSEQISCVLQLRRVAKLPTEKPEFKPIIPSWSFNIDDNLLSWDLFAFGQSESYDWLERVENSNAGFGDCLD